MQPLADHHDYVLPRGDKLQAKLDQAYFLLDSFPVLRSYEACKHAHCHVPLPSLSR